MRQGKQRKQKGGESNHVPFLREVLGLRLGLRRLDPLPSGGALVRLLLELLRRLATAAGAGLFLPCDGCRSLPLLRRHGPPHLRSRELGFGSRLGLEGKAKSGI